MAKRERFGKFVLLEDLEPSSLGSEDRAAKLGPGGFEKIVSILRLKPALGSNAETAKTLMDQVKVAAQLQNPNIVRIYGIGKVESVYYVSYEFVEGKTLGAIFERCRRDTFPFSVDHALLIASKICSALEYSHGRKTETGSRYCHGLLNPGNVLVSYEGEVRVRGFGQWLSRAKEAGALREKELLYLSPEQAAGGAPDTRSDVFAVGALLFEALVGRPLFEGGRAGDVAGRLAAARLQNPTGEDDRLPKPIADILGRSLVQEPSGRYAEIQEMRKAIDTLLFSGDYTPTTFNLAFFMHSIFRDDIDRESKQIKEEREATYAEFLADGAPKPTGNTITLNTTPIPAPPPKAEPVKPPVPEAAASPPLVPPPVREPHPPPPPEPSHAGAPVSAKDAAAGFTFHKETAPKGRTPLLAAALLAILIVGGAAYYFLGGRIAATPSPTPPPPSTLSPEATAALARVKELEDKLKAIEEEKAAAEQKAKEDAAAKLQKEAKAKGTEVDAAALQKAQEEAARKARADQERKAQEERKRLEDVKAAEQQRLADEQRRADEQRKAEEARLAATTTTTTLAPTTTVPAVQAGALVNINDPGVIAPVPEKAPALQYPIVALRQRVEGVVELNVLVDEKGAVADAQVVTGTGGRAGLDEAALDNVKRRRYRPATKDGVAVKVWIPVRVQFKLPS